MWGSLRLAPIIVEKVKDGSYRQEVHGPGTSVGAIEHCFDIVDDVEAQRGAAGPIASQKPLLYDR